MKNEPRSEKAANSLTSSKGSSLLYALAGIIILSMVAVGIQQVSTRSALTEVYQNRRQKAQYMAESGLNYAKSLDKAQLRALKNSTKTFLMSDGEDGFVLDVGDKVGLFYTVGVKGFSGKDQSYESNSIIPQAQIKPRTTSDLSYKEDLFKADGTVAITTNNGYSAQPGVTASDLTTVDQEDHSVTHGNNTTAGHSCNWWEITKDIKGIKNYCKNGVCSFGKGLRIFFSFKYINPGADGFTFAIISADQNTIADCGGYTVSLSDHRGEHLGYAGPGLTGHGLRAPKMAVEFDVWENNKSSCKKADSRYDDDASHIAFVYWGELEGCQTFDDNRHLAGGNNNDGYYDIDGNWYWGSAKKNPLYNSTNPENTKVTTGSNKTYLAVPTLENKKDHTVRIEIKRTDLSGSSGQYAIKAWIDCDPLNDACDDVDDVSMDFTGIAPNLNTSITLDKVFHQKFENIILGITHATGGVAQEFKTEYEEIDFIPD